MVFKSGEQAICIARANWGKVNKLSIWQRLGLASRIYDGPKLNEVVTVVDATVFDGDLFISLKEYYRSPDTGKVRGFDAVNFRPLISDAELAKELETLTAIK